MSDDYEQSRDALELAFWRRRAELLGIEKEQRQRVLAQRDLADATGIQDPVQLHEVITAGVTPDTVAALGIVPLVCVAWASGHVHPKEREVALAAAAAAGIPPGSEAFAMFASWLDERPALDLLELWGAYLRSLNKHLNAETYQELCTSVYSRARKIAEAAGGPSDAGEVTPNEAAMLERIAALLT